MNMLKMCMNPKVLISLGAVAVGILVFAPNLLATALPLLLLAACPLSMLLMPLLMGKQMQQGQGTVVPGARYTCPMHPQVNTAEPGSCPTCGMALVQVGGAPQGAAPGKTLSREEQLSQLQAQLKQVEEQQAAIAHEVAQLHEKETAPSADKAVQEAEEIARRAGQTA